VTKRWQGFGEIENIVFYGQKCELVEILCKTICFVKKLKTGLSYDSAIPILGNI
jgi:hypothetical protein